MKGCKCPVLVLLLFCCGFGYSQSTDTTEIEFQGFKERKIPYKQNVIKFSPIPLLFGQINFCGELRITYERMLTHNQSLSLGFSYNYPSLPLMLSTNLSRNGNIFKGINVFGARGTIAYRYYPLKSREAPEGFFVGPFVSYNFVQLREKGGSGSFVNINYFNANAVCGYQVEFGKGVMMEFVGGLGYRKNFIVEYDANTDKRSVSDIEGILPPLKNVKLVLFINLCYAFG